MYLIHSSSVSALTWSGSWWIWCTKQEVGTHCGWDSSPTYSTIHSHSHLGEIKSHQSTYGHVSLWWKETREPMWSHMRTYDTQHRLSSSSRPSSGLKPWGCEVPCYLFMYLHMVKLASLLFAVEQLKHIQCARSFSAGALDLITAAFQKIMSRF